MESGYSCGGVGFNPWGTRRLAIESAYEVRVTEKERSGYAEAKFRRIGEGHGVPAFGSRGEQVIERQGQWTRSAIAGLSYCDLRLAPCLSAEG